MHLIYNPFTQQVELHHNGTVKVVPQSQLIALGGDVESLVNEARSTAGHAVTVPNQTRAKGITRRVYHNACC